jgi:hypothetical protein
MWGLRGLRRALGIAGALAIAVGTVVIAAPAGAIAPVASLSTTSLNFGPQRVGTFGATQTVTLTNTGAVDLTLTNIDVVGPQRVDYLVNSGTDCATVLASGTSCHVFMVFAALARGTRVAQLQFTDDAADSPQTVSLTGIGTEGYFIAGQFGEVANFGDAIFHGDAADLNLKAPIVSLTTTANGAGYWLLGRDGGIFSFGNAAFYGSTGAMHLNQPVVGLARTPLGKGYWLVASDGGIFSFGDARFHGSTGAIHLNKPVVGMASTPSGKGYWLVASDGGIFAFGDAKFFGSTGAIHLNRPINGMASTPDGKGYWLVASDGGLFSFGNAHYFGSTGGQPVGTIVGMAPTPNGHGYWLGSAIGHVYPFGNAPNLGDLFSVGVTDANDVVGIAATAPPLPASLLPYSAATKAGSTLSTSALGRSLLRRGIVSGLPRVAALYGKS